MKHSFIAAAIALSLGFSATAMAKDINAVDLFVGDFVGVGSVDFDKLVANKMISDAVNATSGQVSGFDKLMNELKAAGVDYKKDIDNVAVAVNEKGKACVAIDAKVSLAAPIEALHQKVQAQATDYNGLKIYNDSKNSAVLLSDKRFLACENVFDIKPMIDNAKAEKPKTLKDRDAAIYKAFNATSKNADIRVGAKMSKYLKEKSAKYKLDDGQGKSIGVADAEAASLSISFAKGLHIEMLAQAKNDAVASTGAEIITTQLNGILGDPSLNEIGLGFVKDGVKIVADKKNLKANIDFSDEQMQVIMALVSDASLAKGK